MDQKYNILEQVLKSEKQWPNSPTTVWLPRFHWVGVLNENYLNAKTMCQLMEEENIKNLKLLSNRAFNKKDTQEKDKDFDKDRRFYSCALSFYNFANTALNTAKQLADNVTRSTNSDENAKQLYEYRKTHKKRAKIIADIRNEVVSHPENLQNASHLSSWSSSCKFSASVTPLTYEIGEAKRYRLDPREDLYWLHGYLNNLFPLLDKCMDIK